MTPPTPVRFGAGDTVILYTDGLVEQRGELIDHSIDGLQASIDPAWSPDETVRQLITRRVQQRTDRTVDDDIAIIVFHCHGSRTSAG